jgi:hypothetical protein
VTSSMNEAETQRFATKAVIAITQDLIRVGHISSKGKTNAEIASEIIRLLKTADVEVVLDHTSEILSQARGFAKSKRLELSCLLYATWFEHWLDSVINTLCRRKKLSDEEISHVIRDTNFDAKSTWLIRLLGGNAIKQDYWKIMKRIIDHRNRFVHYKWKPDREEITKNLDDALETVEKAIRYLNRYENNYIYKKQKGRARKVAFNRT